MSTDFALCILLVVAAAALPENRHIQAKYRSDGNSTSSLKPANVLKANKTSNGLTLMVANCQQVKGYLGRHIHNSKQRPVKTNEDEQTSKTTVNETNFEEMNNAQFITNDRGLSKLLMDSICCIRFVRAPSPNIAKEGFKSTTDLSKSSTATNDNDLMTTSSRSETFAPSSSTTVAAISSNCITSAVGKSNFTPPALNLKAKIKKDNKTLYSRHLATDFKFGQTSTSGYTSPVTEFGRGFKILNPRFKSTTSLAKRRTVKKVFSRYDSTIRRIILESATSKSASSKIIEIRKKSFGAPLRTRHIVNGDYYLLPRRSTFAASTSKTRKVLFKKPYFTANAYSNYYDLIVTKSNSDITALNSATEAPKVIKKLFKKPPTALYTTIKTLGNDYDSTVTETCQEIAASSSVSEITTNVGLRISSNEYDLTGTESGPGATALNAVLETVKTSKEVFNNPFLTQPANAKSFTNDHDLTGLEANLDITTSDSASEITTNADVEESSNDYDLTFTESGAETATSNSALEITNIKKTFYSPSATVSDSAFKVTIQTSVEQSAKDYDLSVTEFSLETTTSNFNLTSNIETSSSDCDLTVTETSLGATTNSVPETVKTRKKLTKKPSLTRHTSEKTSSFHDLIGLESTPEITTPKLASKITLHSDYDLIVTESGLETTTSNSVLEITTTRSKLLKKLVPDQFVNAETSGGNDYFTVTASNPGNTVSNSAFIIIPRTRSVAAETSRSDDDSTVTEFNSEVKTSSPSFETTAETFNNSYNPTVAESSSQTAVSNPEFEITTTEETLGDYDLTVMESSFDTTSLNSAAQNAKTKKQSLRSSSQTQPTRATAETYSDDSDAFSGEYNLAESTVETTAPNPSFEITTPTTEETSGSDNESRFETLTSSPASATTKTRSKFIETLSQTHHRAVEAHYGDYDSTVTTPNPTFEITSTRKLFPESSRPQQTIEDTASSDYYLTVTESSTSSPTSPTSKGVVSGNHSLTVIKSSSGFTKSNPVFEIKRSNRRPSTASLSRNTSSKIPSTGYDSSVTEFSSNLTSEPTKNISQSSTGSADQAGLVTPSSSSSLANLESSTITTALKPKCVARESMLHVGAIPPDSASRLTRVLLSPPMQRVPVLPVVIVPLQWLEKQEAKQFFHKQPTSSKMVFNNEGSLLVQYFMIKRARQTRVAFPVPVMYYV